jgi:hypothetical protein
MSKKDIIDIRIKIVDKYSLRMDEFNNPLPDGEKIAREELAGQLSTAVAKLSEPANSRIGDIARATYKEPESRFADIFFKLNSLIAERYQSFIKKVFPRAKNRLRDRTIYSLSQTSIETPMRQYGGVT